MGRFQNLEPVPEEGIAAVVEILRGGNLFRYSGEARDSEALLFERDFLRDWGGGARFALAANSGSAAIQLALQGIGVQPGDKVLVPAFTFTAVPSAVKVVSAVPVLVECGMDFKVDLEDLDRKMAANPGAKVFLISHMRGYITDMDRVTELCCRHGVTLVEDAAHALGSWWNGRLIGTFGRAATYSFQSYKLINAGEGGMIVTDDEEAFVRMVFDQGAYEGLYERHGVKSDYFAQHLNRRPLSNMRMSNITAAIARAQLPYVGERIRKYAESYNLIRQGLSDCELIEFPPADEREVRVLDSIQFRLKGFRPEQMDAFIELARAEGLPLAAFSARDNARAPWNWLYLGRQPDLPLTRAALATACDMRLTSTLTAADCAFFVRAVLQAARAVAAHKDAVHAATDER